MKNPYTQSRIKKLRQKSLISYLVVLIIRFPHFILWMISKLLPKQMAARIGKGLLAVLAPFDHVVGFIRVWVMTRPWKKLFIALPLIAGFLWIQSTVFLAGNRTDSEKFGSYRKRLLGSVQAKDYARADFLAGKLLMNGAFENDAVTLYAAMVAAHQNGNVPRRDLLMERLTTNLKYAPAHLWYARVLLETGRGNQQITSRAIMHINKAIKIGENPDAIRVYLADVYTQLGRDRQAIQVLEEIEDPEVGASFKLAKLYMDTGEVDKARKLASDVLGQMSSSFAQDKASVAKRVALITLLADIPGGGADVSGELLKLADTIRQMVARTPDDGVLLTQQAEVYMTLAKWYLKQGAAERSQALIYMEKSVATGLIHTDLGETVLNASNLRSDGRLTESQIRDALVSGHGVAISHILLGMDAWKKGSMEQAKFHLGMALLHESRALEVVRRMTVLIAQKSKDSGLAVPSLSFEDNLSWRSAINLLDEMTVIKKDDFDINLLTKALILAEKQRWIEMVALLEPYREKVDEKYRPAVLNMLYRAVSSTGDREKMELYKALIEEQAEENE